MKKIFITLSTLCVFLASCTKEHKRPGKGWHEITYLYAHGLADTQAQADNYQGVLFEGPVYTFDFPDATTQFWRVNFTKTSLGQRPEIEHLKNKLDDRLERDPEAKFVGIGVSRGAATWLNLMGSYAPEEVKALVLESPPDSMETAIGAGLHPFVPGIFMEYDTKGEQPRDTVHSIPKDLPILIICTKEDHLVPYASTIELYRLLKEEHPNVHILVFESGRHAKFVLGKHRQTYRNVAHAFYKKYGLPYDKQAAKAGKKLFSATQPKPEELQ